MYISSVLIAFDIFRSPEPRRSKRDRSLDSFDDHSSQGRFADRDNSYYNRSDDLTESYSRSGYNDRLSDLPPGNKYKSRLVLHIFFIDII